MRILVTIVLVVCSTYIRAQNSVGIGTNSPDVNAVLDLQSPTGDQGILVPRLSTAQRTAMTLAAAQNGMLVYDTGVNTFYYWDGATLTWIQMGGGTDADWVENADTIYNNMHYVVVGRSNAIDYIRMLVVNNGLRTALAGSSSGNGVEAVGVEGYAKGSGINIGTLGISESQAASDTAIGLLGEATGGGVNYSGFFGEGNVFVKNKLGVNSGSPITSLQIGPQFHFDSAFGGLYGLISRNITYDGAGFVKSAAGTGQLIYMGDGGKGEVAMQTYDNGAAGTYGNMLSSLVLDEDGAIIEIQNTTVSPDDPALGISPYNDAAISLGLGNGTGNPSQLRFLDNNGNYIALRGVNGLGGSNYVYTLPAAYPSAAGEVLSSDLAGNMSWITPGGVQSAIIDADGDTEINVEAAPDQDVIHFNLGNSTGYLAAEYFTMIGPRLEVINSGASVFIGQNAGSADDLTSNENTFIGNAAGTATSTGNRNVAIGAGALQANNTTGYNTAVGFTALQLNSTSNNTAVGAYSLSSTTSGFYNTALGYLSGYSNTTGQNNVFIGAGAGRTTTGGSNTYVGSYAGYDATGLGFDNTYLGNQAGRYNTTGGNNVGLGSGTGNTNTTGSANTFIGSLADAGSSNLFNATAIGWNSTVNSSNTVQLGNGANVDFDGALMPNSLPGAAGEVLTSQGAGTSPIWAAPSVSAAWELTGNTIAGTEVLGTNSAHDLNIVAGGVNAMNIDDVTQNIGIGVGFNTAYKVYTSIPSTNTSVRTAYEVQQNYAGASVKTGVSSTLSSDGTGMKRAYYGSVSSTGNQTTYGLYTNSIHTGNTESYGVYNYHNSSTGSGAQYGTRNEMSNTGTGARYGVYNNVLQTSAASTNSMYGNYSILLSSGGGLTVGNYSTNSSSGTGAQYGEYNILSNSGTGNRYGTYNFLNQTNAAATNLMMGSNTYVNHSGSAGTTYGDYIQMAGANVFKYGIYVTGEDLNYFSGHMQLMGAFMPAGSAGLTGEILVSQGANIAPIWQSAAAASANIYNTDGALTGNRTLTGGANTLAFTSTATNGFSVDGTTFSVDAANNRVGVGTAAPSEQLEVSGNVEISSTLNTFMIADDEMVRSNGNTSIYLGQTGGTGAYAVYAGYRAGNVSTGVSNTFVGTESGEANNSGTQNAFFGLRSGQANTTGYNNTFIGRSGGDANITGSNNTTLGYYADVSSSALTNATAIGANAVVGQSNAVVLGGTGANEVEVGIGITNNMSGKLHAYSSTPTYNVSGTDYNSAVYGEAVGSVFSSRGVMGVSWASGTYGIGTYGAAQGTATNNYGVYGIATGGTNNYAGYFDDGNVYIENNLGVGITPSATYNIYSSGASYGIRADGTTMGAYFRDSDGTASVYVAYANYGIYQWSGTDNYFAGNVGVGTTSPSKKIHAVSSPSATYDAAVYGSNTTTNNSGFFGAMAYDAGTNNYGVYAHCDALSNTSPLGVNRAADGALVNFSSAGVVEGQIVVSGTTVSYNAFTGSHYATSEDENIERGMLVTLTGRNDYYHGNKESEILHGIEKSRKANDPKIMGAYLSLIQPDQEHSVENPYQVMAVGNGDMWIVDNGQNLQPGDYLISSDTEGHAMLDKGEYDITYIIARVSEPVNWDEVEETVDGAKHKKVAVFFENFTVNHKADRLENELNELKSQYNSVKADVEYIKSTLGMDVTVEEK